jgi:hypothetical protein
MEPETAQANKENLTTSGTYALLTAQNKSHKHRPKKGAGRVGTTEVTCSRFWVQVYLLVLPAVPDLVNPVLLSP